uniref:Uncharacterized protein n=1 Tax=Cacopsylla melanoneura TaxID=428564 RepID=A0A8D9BTM5_9HEMI
MIMKHRYDYETIRGEKRKDVRGESGVHARIIFFQNKLTKLSRQLEPNSKRDSTRRSLSHSLLLLLLIFLTSLPHSWFLLLPCIHLLPPPLHTPILLIRYLFILILKMEQPARSSVLRVNYLKT